MTPVLEVRGLTKAYGRHTVLDGLDLTVDEGTVLAVTGANGAGKTTLLRCVAGADRPDAGEVLLDGTALDETSPTVRADVACALDDVDHFADLSVVEHLRLCAWAHGEDDPERSVDRVLGALGLDHARDQLPATLSTGQRRRLALAGCLVRPRRLLVLDEPEQRLDAAGRSWLAHTLHTERELGRAVLIASHDEEMVAAVADERVEIGP